MTDKLALDLDELECHALWTLMHSGNKTKTPLPKMGAVKEEKQKNTKEVSDEFLREFIYESNLIDPQPGHKNEPGDPHYDDHLKAARMAIDFANMNVIAPPDIIHKTLMYRLKKMRKHAGKLRTCNVIVGNQICPRYDSLSELLKNWNKHVLLGITQSLDISKDDRENTAWLLHIEYEHVHPWIDGNGRSGRLLMLNHRLLLGLDPIIIKYDERWDYYSKF